MLFSFEFRIQLFWLFRNSGFVSDVFFQGHIFYFLAQNTVTNLIHEAERRLEQGSVVSEGR